MARGLTRGGLIRENFEGVCRSVKGGVLTLQQGDEMAA